MLLHIVNKSPFEREALGSCLKHARPGAGVLLIEDGVYAAARGTSYTATITQALTQISVYALRPDIDARGLQDRLIAGVQVVDYDGFVDLVTTYGASQSWL